MSETFIKIESLQLLEISRQILSYEPVKNLRFNIHFFFDVMPMFPNNAHYTYSSMISIC